MTRLPSKEAMRKKAAHELRELVILTAYLYVVFGVIIFYKYAVLRGEGNRLGTVGFSDHQGSAGRKVYLASTSRWNWRTVP